jgi:hypothetical protein
MRRHPGEHKNRHVDKILRRRVFGATTAICDRVAYQNRDGARRAAKVIPYFEDRPARAYQCRDGCELWHAGYLPELVVQGVVTAGEWYGYAGRPALRDTLLPMIDQIRRRTGGIASFERRVGADGRDLWGAMIDMHGRIYLARDYDDPIEATAAVLREYAAALTGTEAVAA